MGPGAQSMDTTTPSSSFFNVPQLTEDGSNWIIYKGRLLTAVNARGSTMRQYIDGTAKEPDPLKADTARIPQSLNGGTATSDEIKENLKEIQEYHYRNSLVKQQIFSTITDEMYLRVQEFDSTSRIWMELCAIHQDKTKLTQTDLWQHMHETRCQEEGDVKEHFGVLHRLKQSLAGMGVRVEDEDYTTILVGSLPESYRPTLSAISANACMNGKDITLNDLIKIITEEYEHKQLTGQLSTKKGENSALSARFNNTNPQNPGKGGNNAITDVECYNCHRKGHYKSDCWRPGGRKEGQGPQRQGCNIHNNGAQMNQSASAASAPIPQDNFAFTSAEIINNAVAIIDSGATSHFCPDWSNFITFSDIPPQDVCTANGSTISAIGRGDIKINLLLGNQMTEVMLKNAL